MRHWGIALLVGSLLTLSWYFVCPTYRVIGPTETIAMSWPDEHGQSHSEPYNHLDCGKFAAIDLVLWSSVVGCCLLRKEIAAILAFETFGRFPPQSSPTLAAQAVRPTGDSPSATGI